MLKSQKLISKLSFVLATFFVVTALYLPWQSVKAEPAKPTKGITVAPAFVRITLDDDTQESTASVDVTNNYDGPINLSASLHGVDQDRGVFTPSKDLPSGLKSSLSVAPELFSLEPGQSTSVRISLKDSMALGPGSNYAALVIRQSGSNSQSGSLQSAVSVTMFITKLKGASFNLSLQKLITRGLWFGAPKSTVTTLKNNGNVVVVPRGTFTFYKANSSEVYSKGVLNESSIPVFPEAGVTLLTNIKPIKSITWPGKYKLEFKYQFDGADASQIKTFTMVRYYVPSWLVFASVFIIIFIVGAIFLLSKTRKTILQKLNKKQLKNSVRKAISKKTKKSKKRSKKKKIKVKIESGIYRRKF